MRYGKHVLQGLLFVSLSLTQGCNSRADQEISVAAERDSLPAIDPAENNRLIQYNGAINDSIRKALDTFEPFEQVHALALLSIQVKDSLETLRHAELLTNPKDSAVFMPYETRAYQAILDYQQRMASAPAATGRNLSLLRLNRFAEPNDSSMRLLPPAGKAGWLSHGNFFFLGGAPFIDKLEPEEQVVFKDAQGNPETRFTCAATENASYLLSSVYRFKSPAFKISFGPPLRSYDRGPQEVHGIGALVHEFENRVPVMFLTEAGLVPGSLVSITLKLASEDLGCVSDLPHVMFSTSANLKKEEILGIYISYASAPLTSFKLTRHRHNVWSADLNSDGIDDLACVAGTFAGLIDDKMAELLWFVNNNGTWQIIDWAAMLDCT